MAERESRSTHTIHFEPSYHAINELQGDGVGQEVKFAMGDFSQRIWDGQVTRRMSRYSPRIVTADGLAPEISDQNFNAIVPSSTHAWYYMPDQPSRFTESGSVVLLGTDSIAGLQFNYQRSGVYNFLKRGIDDDYTGSLFEMTRGFTPLEFAALTATMFTASAVVRRSKKRLDTVQPEAEKELELDRRDFLGMGIKAMIGVGALSVVKKIAPMGAVFAAGKMESEDLKDAFIDLSEVLGAEENYSLYLNARTAMFILKTKDASDTLGLDRGAPTAIVAGDLHALGIDSLLGSEERCAVIIRDYTESLFDRIDQFAQGKALDPTVLKLLLGAYLIKMSAQTMTDVHPSNGSPEEYALSLAYGIRDQKILPSRRVFEAIKPLTNDLARQLSPEISNEF